MDRCIFELEPNGSARLISGMGAAPVVTYPRVRSLAAPKELRRQNLAAAQTRPSLRPCEQGRK